ncbi:GAF domain-containing protein [Rhizobium leguminosarum]|uniref:GAF domain-containing protein n=2 Tax=Rhizobium leguminosarum TaxID=384 RepID=A0A154IFD3_RHILE|nr:GAF domain-containing protein [Rhizobium leguminosarum]KZA99290.1 hypothetical protein A4A59_23035 [Rhizobium leguminosarum]
MNEKGQPNKDSEAAADSDRLSQLRENIQTGFQDHAQRVKTANTFAKISLVVAGAALAGIGQFVPEPYQTIGRVIGVVGVGLAFLGGIWSYIVDESASPDLLSNAQRAIDEAAKVKSQLAAGQLQNQIDLERYAEDCLNYEEDIETLSQLYTTTGALREYAENEIVRYGGDINRATQNLRDLVARQVHELLSFHGGEHWTLSVYRATENTGRWQLDLIAGQRADRTAEARSHRSWGPGEGAVGHCFQLERELIIKNTQDREQANWFHIPAHLAQADDAKKYVSFAAVPIKVHSFAKPWGVLIASSDRPDRFQTDGFGIGDIQTEPLRMLAGMIALLAANDYVRAGKNADQADAHVKLVHSSSDASSPASGTE